jgi:ketosteroid isomerase-like protein
MPRSNLQIVRAMYDAFSRGDLDAFLADVAPDMEWRFADSFIYGEVNPLFGRDALRNSSLRRIGEEWDQFDSPLDELLDAGDTIVGLGHSVGVHKATGRRLRAQFVHVFTLADGQVTRWRQYVDTRQFAEVTGASRSVPA